MSVLYCDLVSSADHRRTVAAASRVMELEQEPRLERSHRILNHARWSSLAVSRVLLRLLVTVLVPSGPLLLGIEQRRSCTIRLGHCPDRSRRDRPGRQRLTRARGGAYVWVTWLSRLMAGEVHCEWATWFKAHYTEFRKAPSDFQRAQWMAEHTRGVSELVRERTALGETVFKEDQNSFKLTATKAGLVLSGKADLVAQDAAGNYTVYDMKTGLQHESHAIQVMLYMLCLPYGSERFRDKELAGCVVYKDGTRVPIPASAITEAFRHSVRYFVDLLDEAGPPPRTPSETECRYCELTSDDCPERIETGHTATEPALLPLERDT
ncbi:MAG: PD-(D/E)XK nuclease family protein [Chloroflexi bacterium]|nr:PD-(D/E)XK nuclease family protein [Chloroflexota bacterium]